MTNGTDSEQCWSPRIHRQEAGVTFVNAQPGGIWKALYLACVRAVGHIVTLWIVFARLQSRHVSVIWDLCIPSYDSMGVYN